MKRKSSTSTTASAAAIKLPKVKMQPKIATIVFEDPDKDFNFRRATGVPKTADPEQKPNSNPKQETIVDLDLKRTRYEIMKFATKSLKNSERISAEEKMIIELGGKREKNKCINYVELKKQRKEDREKAEETLKMTQQKPRLSSGKKNQKIFANGKKKNTKGGRNSRRMK